MADCKNSKNNKLFADLRGKAEKLLKVRPADQQTYTLEEFESLLHELEVHQVELEMQNEELRNARLEIEESRRKYFDLYDFAPIGYFTCDEKMDCIRDANLACAALLGMERSKIAGKRLQRFIAPESQDTLYFHRQQVLETREKHACELRLAKVAGSPGYGLLESIAVEDDKSRITQVRSALIDITERKQTEETLQQSQKMESIGTLAGGVAHEFNNILGGIIGYTELAKDDLPESSSVRDMLVEVLKLGKRAKDVVGQILSYSRKGNKERKPINPFLLIKEELKVIRATIPSTIEIVEELDEHAGLIMGDQTQIKQTGMNLFMNAAHAMEASGGKLGIGLLSVVLDAEDVKSHPDLDPGEYIKITVSDTGTGIDPEIIDQIFDPFFTTKGVGKGTGMGLAVVNGIVKDHGGSISVSSVLGKGTTFTIFLPKTVKVLEDQQQVEDLQTGTENILIVDDEEFLVIMAKKMLQRLGYTVTAMTSSLETLDLFKKNPQRYDLIITDLTMPHLTGDRLAAEIIAVRPEIPVVLATGYADAVDSEKVKQSGIKAFIPKPFEMQDLAKTIRLILDEK